MSNDAYFEEADKESGIDVLPPAKSNNLPANGSDVLSYRKSLIEQYHKGASGLLQRLKECGKSGMEALVVSLLDEIISETDELKGNELVALQNGELRDASVISFKRAEVLEKAIKAAQSKQLLEKNSGIDIESPSMLIIFKFFLEKSRETFQRMGVGDEISDLFFRTFSDTTENWKKELFERFEELKRQR